MKRLFFIVSVVLLLAGKGLAQHHQFIPGYGFEYNRGIFDRTLGIPEYTGTFVLGTNRADVPYIFFKTGDTTHIWLYNPATGTINAVGESGGGGGGGSGGLTGGNLGSFYRLYSPGSQGMYTLTSDGTVSLDSALSTSLRLKADTTTWLASRWYAHNQTIKDIANFVGNDFDSLRALNFAGFARPTALGIRGNSNSTNTLVSLDSVHSKQTGVSWGLSTITDRAFPGRGTYANLENHHQTIQPGHKEATITAMYYNDARAYGDLAGNPSLYRRGLNQAAAATNAMIINQFLKTATAAGATSTSIVRFGGNTGYSSLSVGGKYNNGWYTQTANDSIQFFTPAGWTNLAWTGTGGDSVNQAFSNFTYKLFCITTASMVTTGIGRANQTWSGVSDGTYNMQRGPISYYYGVLNPNYTYRLTLISNQSTNTFAVDFFGTLEDPSNAVPIIFVGPAHMNSTGYAAGSPTHNHASDAVMDAYNVVADSTVTAFKTAMGSNYPAFMVNVNSAGPNQFDPSTDLGGDGIHWNNLGQRKHWLRELSALPSIAKQLRDGSISFDGVHWYGWRGNGAYQFDGTGSSGGGSSKTAGRGIIDSSDAFINELIKGKTGGDQVILGSHDTNHGMKYVTTDGTGAEGAAHQFYTNNGGTLKEAMNIRYNSYVGLGINPGVHFVVQQATADAAVGVSRFSGATGQTGPLTDWTDVSLGTLSMIEASGAAMFGSGDHAGGYPKPALYIFRNSSIQFMRFYNGSSWEPVIMEASTWQHKAGSGTVFSNTNSSGLTFLGGSTSAAETLELAAGTTSRNPLKFNIGALKTSTTDGSFGYGTNRRLFFSKNTTWKNIPLLDTTTVTDGMIPIGRTSSNDFAVATITSSTLDVTNGSGTIAINIPTTTVTSGSYTPTCADVANTSSITPSIWYYSRSGNLVTVFGKIVVDPAVATFTSLSFTLPPGLASAFSDDSQLSGDGQTLASSTTVKSANLYSDATADGGFMQFSAVDLAATSFWIKFHYFIIAP